MTGAHTGSGSGGSTQGDTGDTTLDDTTAGPETTIDDPTGTGSSGGGDLPKDDPPVILSLSGQGQEGSLYIGQPTLVQLEVEAADDHGLAEVFLQVDDVLLGHVELDGELEYTLQEVLPVISPAQNTPDEEPLIITAWANDGKQLSKVAELLVHIHLPTADPVTPGWLHEYVHDGGPTAGSEFFDVALDAEGEVYAAGYWVDANDGNSHFAMIERISASGGHVCTNSNFLEQVETSEARGAAMTPDGKLIVVGSSLTGGKARVWARRINPDCTIDPNWKADYTAYDDGEEIDTWGLDVAIDDEGSIYIVGYAGELGVRSWPIVLKYLPEFSEPVATYQSEEFPVRLKYHGGWDITYDLARDRVLVTGAKTTPGKPLDQRMMVMALDPSLGEPEAYEVFSDGVDNQHSEGRGIRVRPDGKILVVGYSSKNGELNRGRVWHYGLYFDPNVEELKFTKTPEDQLLSDYGDGHDNATGVDVSPKLPLSKSSEWATSVITEFTGDGQHGLVAKYGVNDVFMWLHLIDDYVSRDQAVAIGALGHVHVAGMWKKAKNLPARAIVRKLSP
ncbi:MAG: delta-60 repeat domain-containing protein [Myxococcales bacterium]|nr:delta-60 repeat domain-containing protein [Myxococcales bacterium]